MTHLYLRDLRKRVDALECDWGWAFPHIYEFADPSGKVYERFENKAYRLYEKEQAAHEAEMARLEAELEATPETEAAAPSPVRDDLCGNAGEAGAAATPANRSLTVAAQKPLIPMGRARERAVFGNLQGRFELRPRAEPTRLVSG